MSRIKNCVLRYKVPTLEFPECEKGEESKKFKQIYFKERFGDLERKERKLKKTTAFLQICETYHSNAEMEEASKVFDKKQVLFQFFLIHARYRTEC